MPSKRRGQPGAEPVLAVNGWTIWMHPCFLDQVERMLAQVEKESWEPGDPESATRKVLNRIVRLVLDEIPQNPSNAKFHHGGTEGLGRHWFRAKFANGRFRLFFRYSEKERLIIYGWVNDQDTLRTYGSRNDAYRVFSDRLSRGEPPDDWADLKAEASSAQLRPRMKNVSKRFRR